MKRNGHGQTCHDSAVRRSASGLQSNGWQVKADVSGFPKPETLAINGQKRRPDIIATKGADTRIIEWETPSSLGKDKGQHAAFRSYARQHKNTHAYVRVCNG